MTLKQSAYILGSIALVLFAMGVLFLGNQREAFAQTVSDIPETVFCILNNTGAPVNVFSTECPDGSPQVPSTSVPACFDTRDNDEDGLTDYPNDPGCGGYFDVDEADPEPEQTPQEECEATGGVWENDDCLTLEEQETACEGAGGTWGAETHICTPAGTDNGGGNNGGDTEGSTTQNSSGGGGGGGGGGWAPPVGEVLGATSTVPEGIACDQYMTAFIKPEGDNDPEQVYRLQALLTTFEGAGLELSGSYDEASVAAVHAFQTKYAEEILAPWGITQSTGFVYLTTRKKMNEIYCDRGQTFPLSEEEQLIIERTKSVPEAVQPAAVSQKKESKESAQVVEVGKVDDEETPVVDTPARSFRDFFRGLFDRFR